MKDGLLPVVAVAGAVSVALIWTMSVHDPYWRLFDTTSLPLSAYTPPDDLSGLQANLTPDYSNSNASASSPDTLIADSDPLQPGSFARSPEAFLLFDIAASEVGAPVMSEPMIAMVPPFEPMPIGEPELAPTAAYEVPRAAVIAPIQFAETDPGIDLVVAYAPTPLPAPVALRDDEVRPDGRSIASMALDPFVTPDAPSQPKFAANVGTEDDLALSHWERVDVQRRLVLAGFDPSGVDGAFGPRTRDAIADFQTAWGYPATGYLETGVLAYLNERTDDAYHALQRQAAAAPTAAPELAPVARERLVATAEKPKGRCARRSDGRIIERQSLACDLAGFSESFVSLGRNRLDDDAGATEVAEGERNRLISGIDR